MTGFDGVPRIVMEGVPDVVYRPGARRNTSPGTRPLMVLSQSLVGVAVLFATFPSQKFWSGGGGVGGETATVTLLDIKSPPPPLQARVYVVDVSGVRVAEPLAVFEPDQP